MKTTGVVAIIAVTAALFLGSCFLAAADGQGAFVFFITVPLCALLLGAGFFLVSSLAPRRGTRLVLSGVLGVQLALLLFFLASMFVSPLQPFPKAVVGFVAHSFEAVTGFSPYVWSHRNREATVRINRDLAEAKAEIAAASLSPGKEWERVCFFGPYTDDAGAAQTLGFLSATLERSAVRSSDDFVALVYLDKSGVVEVIDVRRSPLDLVPLSKQCLTPAEFPLRIQQDANGRNTVAPVTATPDR